MVSHQASYHLHQTYWTSLEPLTRQDTNDLHGLSVSVNWPHRPQDMDFLLAHGHGFIARDKINRPLGAGMWFDYGTDAAMIGMMMTHPKLQAGGLGREILNAIEAQLANCRLRLNATGSAWRLYRSVGFRETASVVQYQGIIRAGRAPASLKDTRDATLQDMPAIAALDRTVFGAIRIQVLAQLFAASQVRVIVQGEQITGFAMCRPFGRGHLIGPLVAASEEDAIRLTQAFLHNRPNSFMRLDADARHINLGHHLIESGLENYDTVVAMTKGEHFGPENAQAQVYALASQALG